MRLRGKVEERREEKERQKGVRQKGNWKEALEEKYFLNYKI